MQGLTGRNQLDRGRQSTSDDRRGKRACLGLLDKVPGPCTQVVVVVVVVVITGQSIQSPSTVGSVHGAGTPWLHMVLVLANSKVDSAFHH